MLLYTKVFDILAIVLSFLFIYAVNFNGLPNFSYIGIVLIPIIFLFHPKHNNIYNLSISLIKNKYFLINVFAYFIFFMFTVSYTVFRNTYDFAFSRPLLHTLASIPACILLASYIFNSYRKDENNFLPIYNYLKYILYIQVFLIIFMLFFPTTAEVINSFTKTTEQIDRLSGYQGSRGLGLSGSIAFGLAVTLAQLLYIVFCLKLIIQNNKLTVADYIILIFTAIAVLSAGRTAIAGVGIFLLSYLLISSKENRWFSIIKFVFLVPLSVVLFSIFLLQLDIPSISRYIFYVFQPIQHFIDYGNFGVSSLQGLEDMYYVPPQETILIGDARYSNLNGSGYYMSVDAGYMRFLLFFGLPLSVLFYSIWIALFYYNYARLKTITPNSSISFFSILILSFIFQYKGEFIFVAVAFNKILFIYLFYSYLLKSKKNIGST